MYCSDNPEVTVGGHAPLRAESSGGQRSTSPYLVEGKRNSSAPLLEPTNKSGKGAEFTGNDLVLNVQESLCTCVSLFYFVRMYMYIYGM